MKFPWMNPAQWDPLTGVPDHTHRESSTQHRFAPKRQLSLLLPLKRCCLQCQGCFLLMFMSLRDANFCTFCVLKNMWWLCERLFCSTWSKKSQWCHQVWMGCLKICFRFSLALWECVKSCFESDLYSFWTHSSLQCLVLPRFIHLHNHLV